MSRKRCRKIRSRKKRAFMTKSKAYRKAIYVLEAVGDHP